MNYIVNPAKNYYRKTFPSIYAKCEREGPAGWRNICPVRPDRARKWLKRLETTGFLGSGPGKTRHRTRQSRIKPPDQNKVLTKGPSNRALKK